MRGDGRDEPVCEGCDGAGECCEGRAGGGEVAWGDGGGELGEEGLGGGSDFDETLCFPDDEGVIELFSDGERRQVPWLNDVRKQYTIQKSRSNSRFHCNRRPQGIDRLRPLRSPQLPSSMNICFGTHRRMRANSQVPCQSMAGMLRRHNQRSHQTYEWTPRRCSHPCLTFRLQCWQ